MSPLLVFFVLVGVIYQTEANPTPSILPTNPDFFPPEESPYADQIAPLVTELTACFDSKLGPIVQQLDEETQTHMKELGEVGLSTYVQFLFDLLADQEYAQKVFLSEGAISPI
ncbi:hypothetical protein O0L34_g17320 [Tuta absoluta]|nr:hypothetical protein O0L34_g17320 [Tuta absoluta]